MNNSNNYPTPPKGVTMPDINVGAPSDYVFYSRPARVDSRYRPLTDQNYNDLREANGLKPISASHSSHYNQQPQSYQHSNTSIPSSTTGIPSYPNYSSAISMPQTSGPLGNQHINNAPKSHHRINGMPISPHNNIQRNCAVPATPPTEGIFRNVYGNTVRNSEYATFGNAPPPSGLHENTIVPSGAPASSLSQTRYIKHGYGSYRGTGIPESNREAASQSQFSHSHYSYPSTHLPPSTQITGNNSSYENSNHILL